MPQNRINIPVWRLADSDIECVDSFNFLGITIDKHVNWVAHTNKVASRISRTTGVLNRLKNILPIYILKTIYTSLIMCYLNYGILVWGHNLNRLIILQKRAVRIISCNKYIAHTEPIFKRLNLLKLEDIFKLHQLKFYYKITKMLLPSYFNCIPLTNINSLHHHNTRAARNLYTHRVNHEFAKKTIRFSIIKIVNNTSALIKIKSIRITSMDSVRI